MPAQTCFHGYNGCISQQAPLFIIGHEVIVLKAHFHKSEHSRLHTQKNLTFTYMTELSHSAQNGFIVPCKKKREKKHTCIVIGQANLWLDISQYMLIKRSFTMITHMSKQRSCYLRNKQEKEEEWKKKAPIVIIRAISWWHIEERNNWWWQINYWTNYCYLSVD